MKGEIYCFPTDCELKPMKLASLQMESFLLESSLAFIELGLVFSSKTFSFWKKKKNKTQYSKEGNYIVKI